MSVDNAIQQIVRESGRLDIVIHNAGQVVLAMRRPNVRAVCTALRRTSGRQTGSYPQTLVLYRMRPGVSAGRLRRRAGRVRYSCLKEAAGEEALMQIQWCCGDEKDLGNRWWSEPERSAVLVGL